MLQASGDGGERRLMEKQLELQQRVIKINPTVRTMPVVMVGPVN